MLCLDSKGAGEYGLTHCSSVIQRQVWLMENEGKSKMEAYDIARKEFYDLRMQEDIERRVAAEEARAVGANFGKSYIELGIELEEKALQQWKEKAIQLLQLKRGRQAAFSGASEEVEGPEVAPEAVLETPEDDATATAAAGAA
jgi:small subunit ribosomal protein S23